MIKKLQVFRIICLALLFLGMAKTPKNYLSENTKKNKELFGANSYKISSKQFQFLLKNKNKVRFIITPPYYRVNTAIGVSTDGTVDKIKVLVYRLNDKKDEKGELLEATMDKEEYKFWELEDRANHFMVEIIMVESKGGVEGSYVELLHGFKELPEQIKESEFKYHTDEGEKPTGKQIPPCLPQNYLGSCTAGPEGAIYRLE
jgi:hypothetical protein